MTSPPTTVRPGSQGASEAELDQLASLLLAGRVVLLPTETVYGLAARADDPAALERLRELKGRPPEVALSWHLAASRADAVLDLLEDEGLALAPLARRLAADYWPGPVTLVMPVQLPAGHPASELVVQGRLGLRAPAHPITEAVLARVAAPVVMSSANRHGEPPATDAPGALAALFGSAAGPASDGQLAGIVDAGPTASASAELASAVLALEPGRFALLRDGLLSLDDLRRSAGLRIGFACTGNTCRSPMAEGLARQALAGRLSAGPPPTDQGSRRRLLADFGFEVRSMGLAAYPGAPASPHAVDAMARRGVDITRHQSQPADLAALRDLDLVLTMTRGHRDALVDGLLSSGDEGLAELAGRVEQLDPHGLDISDPFGGDAARYEAAARDIEDAIQARLDGWA